MDKNGITIPELLKPISKTVHYIKGTYLPPVVIYNVFQLTPEQLKAELLMYSTMFKDQPKPKV